MAPVKRPKRIVSYHDFRASEWERLRERFPEFDARASKWKDGASLRNIDYMFVPKPNLFFKDVWHCGNSATALKLLETIATFPDVTALDFKGRWLNVVWNHDGLPHELPDLIYNEGRTVITG